MALVEVQPEPEITMRVIELGDLARTARLHQELLPGSFFASLGPRFLQTYHRSFATSPAGVALVAERDGVIVGFIVGTVDEATHYRHVIHRDRRALGGRGMVALLHQPSLLAHFIQTRAYRYVRGLLRLSRPGPSACHDLRIVRGVLSHVAVRAEDRGLGIGALLVAAFVDAARAQGARSLRLTVALDNVGPQRLYKRAGWDRGEIQEDVDGKEWLVYERTVRQ